MSDISSVRVKGIQPQYAVTMDAVTMEVSMILTLLGLLLIALGVLLLLLRRRRQARLLAITATPTSAIGEVLRLHQESAGARGAGSVGQLVEVKGMIRCDAPLTAESPLGSHDPREIRWGEWISKPSIFMRFHGVFLGNQHAMWSKQHNGKVSNARYRCRCSTGV
jgi:LPXTG-motif cell wall-anchored protein